MVAESLAVRHQLQVMNGSWRRAPRLTPWDRLLFGFCAGCIPVKQFAKCAVILKPSSLTRLHYDYRLAARGLNPKSFYAQQTLHK